MSPLRLCVAVITLWWVARTIGRASDARTRSPELLGALAAVSMPSTPWTPANNEPERPKRICQDCEVVTAEPTCWMCEGPTDATAKKLSDLAGCASDDYAGLRDVRAVAGKLRLDPGLYGPSGTVYP